jgi:hypothetical protein
MMIRFLIRKAKFRLAIASAPLCLMFPMGTSLAHSPATPAHAQPSADPSLKKTQGDIDDALVAYVHETDRRAEQDEVSREKQRRQPRRKTGH